MFHMQRTKEADADKTHPRTQFSCNEEKTRSLGGGGATTTAAVLEASEGDVWFFIEGPL